MSSNIVELPYKYYPDPTKGKPVYLGYIYIGEPNTDPEVLINRKVVNMTGSCACPDEGTEISQPIRTSAGGVPEFNGSPVILSTDGNYSIKVLNSKGDQVYYAGNEGDSASEFATVAEMKATIAVFPQGKTLTTTTNKGSNKGGATYLVVTKADHDAQRGVTVVDEQWDHALTDGKVALFQMTGTHARIEQAGIYEGEDPVQAIRTGLKSVYFKKIKLEAGVEYPVSINWPNVGGFKTPISLSGVYQSLIGDGSILQLETNDLTGYNIVSNTGIECEVGGVIIRGDKDTHTGVTGEFGMGVANRGSIKAYMHDLVIENCWGDGWYEAGIAPNYFTKDTRAENITINNCRRNGWSLITAKGLRATNIEINDTAGTSPQVGLDIEPNTSTDELEDIIIDGIRTNRSASGGITAYMGGWTGSIPNRKVLGVTIKNHISTDDQIAFTATKLFTQVGGELISGHITLIDPVAIRSKVGPYVMRDWTAAHPIDVNLVRPKLIDCNEVANTSTLNSAAFVSYRLSGDLGNDDTLSGFNVESPSIMSTDANYNLFSYCIQSDYKHPAVPNVKVKGFSITGNATSAGIRNSFGSSYLQGAYDINFPEVTLTQSTTVGLTSSTFGRVGKFRLVSASDKTVTIGALGEDNKPTEFYATTNNWILKPPAGGRFIYAGSYLAVDQELRTSGSYAGVKFTVAATSNPLNFYVESSPVNGLVSVP